MMAKSKAINKPGANESREEAREAVRTLIRWAGDDPDRAGMIETPDRVLRFYEEFFTGYGAKTEDYTGSIANDIVYDDFILVKDIRIASFCEHHLLPATGSAHIAYIPGGNIAGIGTLARIASDCARRFTTQEAITTDIAAMMTQAFAPQGIAIAVSLTHGCMGLRDRTQQDSAVMTTKFSGLFRDNPDIQKQFIMLVNAKHDPAA